MSFLNFRRACGALVLALSVSVAACGGDDDKDGDNNDADANSVEGRCESVADKIYGCNVSCSDGLITQSEFVSNCVAASPALTEADRDEIVDASCAELDDFLCQDGGGACPGSQVCAPIQDAGVCVISFDDESINIPETAQDCSTATSNTGCPSGFGCLTNAGETDGYCLQICTP